MTWTKLGDEFTDECWTLTADAFRLHVEGLVWSNRKGMDGQLAKDDMLRWAHRPEAAEELVAIGWWEDHGGHYKIIHHIGYQRTREQIAKQSIVNRANRAKGKARPVRAKSQSHDESSDESSDERDRTGQARTRTGDAAKKTTTTASSCAPTAASGSRAVTRQPAGRTRTGAAAATKSPWPICTPVKTSRPGHEPPRHRRPRPVNRDRPLHLVLLRARHLQQQRSLPRIVC